MNLLFERSQYSGIGNASFRLTGKLELDEEEQVLVKRHRLDHAVLIEVFQPTLFRRALIVSLLCFMFLSIVGFQLDFVQELMMTRRSRYSSPGISVGSIFTTVGVFLAISLLIGYWYYHQKRETIHVRDLMHGRYFFCNSVIELARKEAWLETICAFLRQVMESAKHWDGESRIPIEALPKDEAKQIIIKGI